MSSIPTAASLLKYNTPVLISKNTEKKINKNPRTKQPPTVAVMGGGGPVPSPPKIKSITPETQRNKQTEEILDNVLPPREWSEEGQLWVQKVSSTPATRLDVLNLQEQLDTLLQQRQARETGICPVRRDLYSQCFDEIIRQVTINCGERGILLLRVRDEILMTIASYQTLYQSSIAFGMRKVLLAELGKLELEQKVSAMESQQRSLEHQVMELRNKCDTIEKTEAEKRQLSEKKHQEELQALRKTNQQLKAQLEGIITPQKK